MSPFLASARTFNTLASSLFMPNCTTKLADSLPQKFGQRKQLVGKKNKTFVRGAHTEGRHEFYISWKRGFLLWGHPSLPQSHCIYRRGGKPPSKSITHNKTSLSTTNEQSCLNSSRTQQCQRKSLIFGETSYACLLSCQDLGLRSKLKTLMVVR